MAVHETRLSQYRAVAVFLADEKELSFESELQGCSDEVIDVITAKAPNVELKEVSMG